MNGRKTASPTCAGVAMSRRARPAATRYCCAADFIPNLEGSMIDHIGFPVSDYQRSKEFYAKALAPLDYGLVMEVTQEQTGHDPAAGFGANGKPDFWIGGGGGLKKTPPVALLAQERPPAGGFFHETLSRGGAGRHGPPPRRPRQPPPPTTARHPPPTP